MLTPAGRAKGAWLGLGAGGIAVFAMLVLNLAAGLPSLIDVLGTGLALLLPGPVFGAMIDVLQERGRPLLLMGMATMILVISALLGGVMARWTWRLVAAAPAETPSRRGTSWGRWLIPGVGLWVVTLPLVAVAEGGLRAAATWTTLLDWVVLSGIVEVLLNLPQLGGSSAGVTGSQRVGVLTRRSFLVATGGVLGAASLGYLGTRILAAGSPSLPKIVGGGPLLGRLPAGVTPTSDFYVVSIDLFGPPRVDPNSWRLTVAGSRRVAVGYQELLTMPSVEQTQTLECISNPVGGTLISNGVWRGVRLSTLLNRAGVPAGTENIVFHCADGYSESLPVDEAMASSTLIATRLNGSVLPSQHGFPARILVAGHYGMKDPKWLTGISTTPNGFTGYWEQQGWNAAAVPQIFSRFDFPSGSARVTSGQQYLLTGIAFAGELGVGEVQVSFDGGSRWTEAALQPPLSPYAWTIWSLPWRPNSGLYTLSVRAADGLGRFQVRGGGGTYPNGASGYQVIVVSVV
ncbi:MAG: molybdopterin-dependent oxidoreductase [Candidatus Dormibacteria bacterium]